MNIPRRRFPALVILLSLTTLASCANVTRPSVETAGRFEVEDRLTQLLAAYAANDQEQIVRMLDPVQFTIYGSDLSEVIRTPADLRQMMTDDFRLWRTAKFGELQDLDIRVQGNLASAFFHVPFSAGGQPPLSVRFSTVWRKIDGQWFLTQSANTVPTVGSSARELLKRR